jgi:CTP:molybdopterin cytidylyltransferase MocA
MGSPKALLTLPDGRPFITRVVETLREAGLQSIIVVTGVHHSQTRAACASLIDKGTMRCVQNPDPSRGQFSSLLVGMDAAINDATPGLLVTLVDVPLVTTSTVRRLIETWERTRAPIVRPAIGEQHGHPVVFDRQLFDQLRSTSPEAGAKAVVRSHAALIENVPVTDLGCLVDVDTPQDYRALGMVR